MLRQNSLKEIVRIVTRTCLGYKKGERFLIVCDDLLHALADDFYRIAKQLGIECVKVQMPPNKVHGEEPPLTVSEALKSADLAVLLTSMSLSHTKSRKRASKKYGVRIASLPGITKKILERSIRISYVTLDRKASSLAKDFTKGKRIEVFTEKGTHLVMSIKGRKAFKDNGLYTKRGSFGNLPAGEVCIAPVEGTTEGTLVVDGSAPHVGKFKKPLKIYIKDGYAQNVPLPEMKPLVKMYGKCILNVAEFGIGLNPKAKVTGNVLEDEKAKNTAHLAFGNNISFGGKVLCPSHMDFVFMNPDLYIDGKELKI